MVLVYIVPVMTGVLSVSQSDSDTRETSGTATATTRGPNGDIIAIAIIASDLLYTVLYNSHYTSLDGYHKICLLLIH